VYGAVCVCVVQCVCGVVCVVQCVVYLTKRMSAEFSEWVLPNRNGCSTVGIGFLGTGGLSDN